MVTCRRRNVMFLSRQLLFWNISQNIFFLLEDEIKGKIIRKLTFQNQMSKQNCKNPASDTIDRVKKLCEVNVLDNSIFSFKTFT